MSELFQSPSFRRRVRIYRFIYALANTIRWPHWPVLNVVWHFWASIADEGVKATCKPRWGMLTFAYLNDGVKPTLWHTWRQMTHDQSDPYTGTYVGGAPRSLAEAKAWDAQWEAERNQRETEFG